MTTNMTPADWRRFAALLNLIRAGKGMGPSFNEIGAAWDIRSKGTITNYLNRIEAAGLIHELRYLAVCQPAVSHNVREDQRHHWRVVGCFVIDKPIHRVGWQLRFAAERIQHFHREPTAPPLRDGVGRSP